MADNMYEYDTILTVLKSELDRLIYFLNSTLHNYEQPVIRGFSKSDPSIQKPYSPDDTVSISVLLCIVTLPLLVITIRMFTRPVGSDTALQRPRPKGLVGGALLTALIAAWIKVSRGRLAPNFYEGCRPLVSRAHQDKPDWQTSYECRYPDRLREISRSFPCMYTSLSSFSWIYLLINCFYNSSSSRLLRSVVILTCLAPPIVIAITRLHDNRSHPSDVIVGCMLGAFIAMVSALAGCMLDIFIATISALGKKETVRVENDQVRNIIILCHSNENQRLSLTVVTDALHDTFIKKVSKLIESTLNVMPSIRVCSSARYSNIEGFVDELRNRSSGFVEGVALPYNDLDSFTLDGWDKSNVVILCHSIENRRLSLTDVADALSDTFIKKVSKLIGNDSLIVIAHDDQLLRVRMDQEETIQSRQPTVYKSAEKTPKWKILAGNLGKHKSHDVLCEDDWDIILDVISE